MIGKAYTHKRVTSLIALPAHQSGILRAIDKPNHAVMTQHK
jgi:hypothetical protein